MRVAVIVCVCALAVPIAAAAQAPATPAWQAPTPAEGAIFTVVAGTQLAFTLSAVSADPASVFHVASSELPPGATLTSADGNPGTAAFRWTPRAAQVGEYAVVFSATPSGDPPALTRRIAISVTPELPIRLSGVGNVTRAAVVLRPVSARARPSAAAPVVARVGMLTEEYARRAITLPLFPTITEEQIGAVTDGLAAAL